MAVNDQSDPRLQSFVYQIYTPLTEDQSQATIVGPPNMSVTICSPTVYAQDAIVNLDSATRTLNSAQPVAERPATNLPFLSGSAAFNGYYFNVSQYGPIVDQRKQATMFGLVSVIYQAALDYPGGMPQAYVDNAHYNLTNTIYQNYLSLIALNNYLNDTAPVTSSSINMSSTTLQNLLFVSLLSAGLISGFLFILAALVLSALILHWRSFGKVGLRVYPGSMAGTGMAMVGGDVATLLNNPDTTRREMKATLRRYRWGLVDGKVSAEGGVRAEQWKGES